MKTKPTTTKTTTINLFSVFKHTEKIDKEASDIAIVLKQYNGFAPEEATAVFIKLKKLGYTIFKITSEIDKYDLDYPNVIFNATRPMTPEELKKDKIKEEEAKIDAKNRKYKQEQSEKDWKLFINKIIR